MYISIYINAITIINIDSAIPLTPLQLFPCNVVSVLYAVYLTCISSQLVILFIIREEVRIGLRLKLRFQNYMNK
nr:MAG TPA: hypothetical protein [Caudoviricetes sp.]DAI32635.1 MAG TPA: hypothetical protein [Caudoviricetes sp.]DAI49131.1 MAG TPA: hypothetical protein [Bacteriophage sp.]